MVTPKNERKSPSNTLTADPSYWLWMDRETEAPLRVLGGKAEGLRRKE
jgi:hypothetical protein